MIPLHCRAARARPREGAGRGAGLSGVRVQPVIPTPFVNEAAYAVMEGVAEPEVVDTIARLGSRIRWARSGSRPIGLDTCVAIDEVLHAGSGTRSTRPARSCGSTSPPAAWAGRQAGLVHDEPLDPRVGVNLRGPDRTRRVVEVAFRLVLRRPTDAEARELCGSRRTERSRGQRCCTSRHRGGVRARACARRRGISAAGACR